MDAKLVWKELGADLSVETLSLLTDSGLETAVILSLFCDRRAEADDTLPDNSGDRRGWWADAYPSVLGDQWGSRLWLLSREKQLATVLARAKEYAEEALAWMVEDGVAAAVEVTAEIVRTGVLGLEVVITRPDGEALQYKFQSLWEAS